MQRPDLIEDARYDTNFKRAERRDEVRAIVEAWTQQRTRAEVVDALGGAVPVAPVNNVVDIFEDDHARIRGMLVEVEHPGSSKPVVLAGQPIKFSVTPSGIRGRGPILDEHGAEILAELRERRLAATEGAT